MPFEVPESWRWTTIEDLLINRDSERIPLSLAVRNKQHKKEYNYYGAAGVIDKVEGYLFSERLLLIGEDGANLLSRAKDNAFFADGKYWVNNHAHVLDCSEKEVLTYVALVINSMALDPYVTGSAQPKLSQDNLNKILIPLPPLAEQRRIIYAINNYSGYLSNIENDKESIEHIIDLLKQLILNLAITGKLVSQELNDEPAIELLKRINPNYKPCDNRHYENVPDSWEICQLKDIFDITMGQSPAGNTINEKYGTEFHQGKISFTEKYLSESGQYTTTPSKTVAPESLLLCVRAPVGVVNITKREICIGRGLCSLRPKYDIDCMYWLYILSTLKDYFEENATGSTFKAISGDIIRNACIPFPPLSEQKRILSKINELFCVVDKIATEL